MEDFWSVIPACGFDPRLWRSTGMCANRAGSLSRKQVIRKGLGVRIPPSPLLSRFGRIGKCTCLLSRGRLVRHPGSGPGSGAHNNIGMCCNWKTGWSQKPAAIGHCGFDSHHVDFNYHIYFPPFWRKAPMGS